MPISGTSGTVELTEVGTVSSVRGWEIRLTADAIAYAASSTKVSRPKIDGPRDWSGTFNAYGDTPVVKPGDTFTFRGNSAGFGVEGSAIASTVEMVCNLESGEAVSYTVSFDAMGPLSFTSGGGVDTSLPLMLAPMALGPENISLTAFIGGGSVNLAHWRSWRVSITREHPVYVAASSRKFRQRVLGLLEGEFSIEAYVEPGGVALVPGAYMRAELYTTPTRKWHLSFGLVTEVRPEVDVEGPNVVPVTISLAYSTYAVDAAGNVTEGLLTAPGGVRWWPP